MQRFNNILYIAEPDSECTSALERAISLALSNQASLTVVNVIDEKMAKMSSHHHAFPLQNYWMEIIEEHQDRLDEMVTPWCGKYKIHTEVLIGVPPN